MEKGFREVVCPGSTVQRCGQKIRLTVTKKDYKKVVEVRCPKCDVVFQTTIPEPALRSGGKASSLFDEKDPFGFFKTADDIFNAKK
ncbi:MAG: hypothetical protein M0P64_00545 [Candidatus Pacebacteria bacterium]|jgi:phage FluMu protein Com|nr:hypothetical protein [Candidatus Paceibacterota bacterium]